MKINEIKALDYQLQDDRLTIPFAETTVEAVLALEPATLTVRTDTGDIVEILAGFSLKTVTVAAEDPTKVTAVLERGADDSTARALDTLSAALVEAKGQISELQSANTDVMDALTELADIVAAGGEN